MLASVTIFCTVLAYFMYYRVYYLLGLGDDVAIRDDAML